MQNTKNLDESLYNIIQTFAKGFCIISALVVLMMIQ